MRQCQYEGGGIKRGGGRAAGRLKYDYLMCAQLTHCLNEPRGVELLAIGNRSASWPDSVLYNLTFTLRWKRTSMAASFQRIWPGSTATATRTSSAQRAPAAPAEEAAPAMPQRMAAITSATTKAAAPRQRLRRRQQLPHWPTMMTITVWRIRRTARVPVSGKFLPHSHIHNKHSYTHTHTHSHTHQHTHTHTFVYKLYLL